MLVTRVRCVHAAVAGMAQGQVAYDPDVARRAAALARQLSALDDPGLGAEERRETNAALMAVLAAFVTKGTDAGRHAVVHGMAGQGRGCSRRPSHVRPCPGPAAVPRGLCALPTPPPLRLWPLQPGPPDPSPRRLHACMHAGWTLVDQINKAYDPTVPTQAPRNPRGRPGGPPGRGAAASAAGVAQRLAERLATP